uniref:Uncharacterized protein n=1 Tax=Anopheles atroparvus TaxID=41427 RepID=A0A182JMF4_ANOAO
LLAVNGYRYVKNRKGVNRTYWICRKKTSGGCRARITTISEPGNFTPTVVLFTGEHSHPRDDGTLKGVGESPTEEQFRAKDQTPKDNSSTEVDSETDTVLPVYLYKHISLKRDLLAFDSERE